MNERDWTQESVTVAEEGKTRSPEQILTETPRSFRPLDALQVGDRAFYRVVYGLDPAWEDIQYIAGASGKSSHEVLEHIQAVYRKNARRFRDPAKLMEKVASAYSRLTELTEEEQTLEERREALSHQRPMDEKQMREVAKRLRQIGERMTQLRALQKKWREEGEKVLRIPSKEVAKIFGISPAAVDKRVERIGRQVRELFEREGEDDESRGDRQPAL